MLADGTIASVSGEYLHYSAETADMFEQAEGYVAQSVGNMALAQSAVGGSYMPRAGGLVYKKGWKTYNFEVADYHTYVAGGVRVHNKSYNYGIQSGDTLSQIAANNNQLLSYKNGAHAHQKTGRVEGA